MKTSVIDIGGTNVNLLATGRKEPVKTPSGPAMTPQKMVPEVERHSRIQGCATGD